VSSAERTRNAAAAAAPPRPPARSAERSRSSATSSSGAGAAPARCQALRSGSVPGSLASASARCTADLSPTVAARYTAERTSGCRRTTWVCSTRSRPVFSTASRACRPTPGSSAARHSNVGEPSGSAAAISSRRRESTGSARPRAWKLSAIRSLRAGAVARTPNPPASRTGGSPRGSCSTASGLPRDSATMRSRTDSSSGPWITESSSRRAASSQSPSIRSAGRCRHPVSQSRVARSRRTDSLPRRRARKSSTSADARSSHWQSSTMHTRGVPRAASDSRPSTAAHTSSRSGASPRTRPKATPRAAPCASGRSSSRSSTGRHRRCSAAKASSRSDSTPEARRTVSPSASPAAWSRSAVLPMPGSPASTRTALRPVRTDTSRSLKTARSRHRPRSFGVRLLRQ